MIEENTPKLPLIDFFFCKKKK